ncbi:cytochrome b5 [Atractiella rhizophila]|nr:cytochrome b5 [Atractiella rhizophila]
MFRAIFRLSLFIGAISILLSQLISRGIVDPVPVVEFLKSDNVPAFVSTKVKAAEEILEKSKLKRYTPEELAKYDGTDPTKPILVGLDGWVFDMSAKPGTWGPEGGYSHFAGHDYARAFVTGCSRVEEHQTHDTRGLTDEQREQLEYFKNFYANHQDYKKVGYVINPLIDPNSPVPPNSCRGGPVYQM